MKKSLIILAVLLTGLLHIQAQSSIIVSPEGGFHFTGTKYTGDLDFSNSFPVSGIDEGSIIGFSGGLMTGIQIKNWAFLTGLKFNRKGGDVTVTSRDPQNPFIITQSDGTQVAAVGEFTEETVHNWLSVPLLARVQLGDGPLKFGLALGPQVNFALGQAKVTTEYNLDGINLPSRETELDYGDTSGELYKKSHVSLVIQPHVAYEINDKGALRVGLTFESGGDIVNENYIVAGPRNIDATAKSRVFGLHIAYEYKFDLNVGVKY